MPIAKVHFSGGEVSKAQIERFLLRASEVYADVLDCPVERIRVFFIPHPEDMAAVQGQVPGPRSVFFEFFVLEGRPLAQRQQLARAFCELIETLLQVASNNIRGRCIRVEPEEWCIGGQFADQLRSAEIAQRKNTECR